MGRVPGETPEDSLLDFTASPAPGWTRGIPLKVLFLTPQLPWPLDQGARIRNYHLLRAVAAEHTVDLLSLDAAPSPPALSQGERGPDVLPWGENGILLPSPPGRGVGGEGTFACWRALT
jgi:hypothetical protein